MKIAFFGLPLAALLLQHDGHQIALAVLSPLAAGGRRRLVAKIGADRVISWENGRARIAAALSEAQADLLVSWFFTQRIEKQWLDLAAKGGIGAHPSLLPRHRGPNPYFACIDQGDEHTGVSIHRLEEQYDTGAVLATRSLLVGDSDAWQLARRLDRPSLTLLRQVVTRIAQGQIPEEILQDESKATWAPEPFGALLQADFHWPSQRILRRIRALSPVPGLALEVRGLRFFVTRASVARSPVIALQPGEAAVVRENSAPSLQVCTSDGALIIERAALGDNEGPWQSSEGLECDRAALAEALLRHAPDLAAL